MRSTPAYPWLYLFCIADIEGVNILRLFEGREFERK